MGQVQLTELNQIITAKSLLADSQDILNQMKVESKLSNAEIRSMQRMCLV